MRKIQEIQIVVKLSYFGFTRTCDEVVVSECHVIPSPVNLIGCPVNFLGTANLVVKLSVTLNFSRVYFATRVGGFALQIITSIFDNFYL